MKEKEVRQLIDEGWVHATAIIEVAGIPKEHVEATIKGVVDQIRQNSHIRITKEDYAEATENEKVFFTFVEMDALFKDLETLAGFCFDNMPSSVEIIDPEKLFVPAQSISNFLNDVGTRLHKSDAEIKNLRFENKMVQANISAILQNLIIMSLRFKDKTVEELCQDCGIRQEHLTAVLQVLMKQGIIEFDGKTVFLNPKFRREFPTKKEESDNTA